MKKHVPLLIFSALIASATTPSIADEPTTIDAIRVTADRATEEAKYDSQKVSIITKKDIEKKQAKNVEEIIFNETGVSRTVDAMGRVGVSIRGAEARHTLILIDGQPALGEFAKYMGAADEVSRIGTENVERIEIIQGAASSKYGADAIGGVVNIITKKASKTPKLQFNLEGRKPAKAIKGVENSPYGNFFLRADSGAIGNARFSIYGSKRQIMPIASSESRRQVSVLFAQDMSEFPDNSLRYYGDTSTIGAMGSYDINKNHKVEFRTDHFNENLHRYVKRSNSDMEPIVQFKRNADRDTYNLTYTGRGSNTNWRLESNYTRIVENDISLTSDKATNTYEGKNTLNSVDNIDHRQASFKGSIEHLANDKHMLAFGFGYSKEDGSGSRLKSAPHTYIKEIDPWDYDKALYVEPKKSSEAQNLGRAEAKVSSRVHAYKFNYDKNGIPYWDFDYETTGYTPNDPNTQEAPISFNEYINNQGSFDSWLGSGLTEKQKENKQKFNNLLYEENKEDLLKNPNFREWQKDNLMREYFTKNPTFNLKFNGKQFLQVYNERQNKLVFGEAAIKKYYFTIQDTWTPNFDTTITPILRYDHSSIYGGHVTASLGVTHNLKSDPNTRIKFNVGTGYAEPGMGELYYNWEMFGGNPTGFGKARLGWYWIGNPNLKPEKSLNIDFGIEKDMKNTSIKATVFHNKIKDYLSIYFTGNILDFNPWLNETSAQGFWKFMYAPDMIYSFKNIGKAEITGGDLEIRQKLGKHWSTRLGYTYLNARNKSDASMPAKLLDKPTHKFDIGLNYDNKESGWSGSIWGNIYLDVLDSNALSSGGSYMETDGWGAPHPSITYHFKDKDKQEYQKKSYSIWHLMVQKKLSKDSLAYFGIDNLFNHRDDDRAFQQRTYRAGLNFKLNDVFDTKAAIDPNTGVIKVAKMDPFIKAPFDISLEKGTTFSGDMIVRNNYTLGENKPKGHVRPDSIVDPSAYKNMEDPKENSLETRVRIGVDSRLSKNTHVSLIGELAAYEDTDTRASVGNKGPKHANLVKAEVTQHQNRWDYSIGRLQENFGATKYWFDKSFDGGRAVYTNNKSQFTVGVGSFKHSTGIKDSPYTHAEHRVFNRPPYLSEFLGIERSNFGFFSGGLKDVPNANENVAWAPQIFKILRDYAKTHELVKPPTSWTAPKNLIKETYPIEEVVKKLKRMQDIVLKAYAGNNRLFNSGPKELPWGNLYLKGRQIAIPSEQLDLEVQTKDGLRHYGGPKATANDNAIYTYETSLDLSEAADRKVYESLKFIAIDLGDRDLFAETTRNTFLTTWWDKHGDEYVSSMEKLLRYKLNDDTITITTPKETIKKQIVESLFLTPDNSRMMGITDSDELNTPNILVSFFENMARALEYVDNESILPRDALAITGYFVPTEGTVLVGDEIPAIEKAFYLKGKHKINNHIGVTAWYLHSFDDDTFTIAHAHGNKNDVYSFDKIANIIGVGAQVRLNDYSAVSFDAGINTTDFGKHMNGSTIYNHKFGTNIFDIEGHKDGSTPTFWTVRFDVGATDVDVPGSWSAFADYKYFEHGSFFGGNGTGSLPDRYLDGVKSFTLGGAYVPARNWLLEAFYTLGAKGINPRDTLFGAENFKLGNYTRVQVTYKF